MNLPIDREFIAQVVIALAICAGGWMMLVQPKTAEIARLESELAKPVESSPVTSEAGIEDLAKRCAGFKQRLEDVRRRNMVADDTSSLYATIMRLASTHGVRVQGMQPTPPRESIKPTPVRAARLEIAVSGEYEKVARFLDAVGEIDAFIRPSSLELIPLNDDERNTVSARFSCDVLAFNLDKALSGTAEVAHGS